MGLVPKMLNGTRTRCACDYISATGDLNNQKLQPYLLKKKRNEVMPHIVWENSQCHSPQPIQNILYIKARSLPYNLKELTSKIYHEVL